MPFSLAFEATASAVLPSFRPITLVGVLWLAESFSCATVCGVQGLPVLRVEFGSGYRDGPLFK